MSNFDSFPIPGSAPENPVILSVEQYHGLRIGAADPEINAVGGYLSQNSEGEDPGIWVQYPERMLSDVRGVGRAIWDIACIQWSAGQYGQKVHDAAVYVSKFDGNQAATVADWQIQDVQEQGLLETV